MTSRLALVVLVMLAACSRREDAKPNAVDERQPRQLDPPPQNVHALPPHAIRADGVGPYKLGVSLEQLANQVPSGARNALAEIPNVVRLSVLHAEDDAILIGGEPLGRSSFIAVVGGTIARTGSGVHVGSTREELVRALGAPAGDVDRARDPRLVAPSNLRELRAIVEADRVVGLVVAAEPPQRADEGCTRPAIDNDDPMRARARFGACMTTAGELVTVDGDELAVRSLDGSDRLLATTRIPIAAGNLVFAAALRGPDGRDEVIAVARSDDSQVRIWSIYGYRLEGGRLVKSIDPTAVYQVTPAHARMIAADLRDLDLVLELASRADAIEVGGLLTTRHGEVLRDLLVLSPVQVPRRRAKSPTLDPSDAGITDAIDSRMQ